MTNVRICPNCKSKDVLLVTKAIDPGTRYECQNCGLTSPLFPAVDVGKARKIKETKPRAIPLSRVYGKELSWAVLLLYLAGFILGVLGLIFIFFRT